MLYRTVMERGRGRCEGDKKVWLAGVSAVRVMCMGLCLGKFVAIRRGKNRNMRGFSWGKSAPSDDDAAVAAAAAVLVPIYRRSYQ